MRTDMIRLQQEVNVLEAVIVAMDKRYESALKYIYFLIAALAVFCALTFFGLYRLNESLKGDHTEWKKETIFQI